MTIKNAIVSAFLAGTYALLPSAAVASEEGAITGPVQVSSNKQMHAVIMKWKTPEGSDAYRMVSCNQPAVFTSQDGIVRVPNDKYGLQSVAKECARAGLSPRFSIGEDKIQMSSFTVEEEAVQREIMSTHGMMAVSTYKKSNTVVMGWTTPKGEQAYRVYFCNQAASFSTSTGSVNVAANAAAMEVFAGQCRAGGATQGFAIPKPKKQPTYTAYTLK